MEQLKPTMVTFYDKKTFKILSQFNIYDLKDLEGKETAEVGYKLYDYEPGINDIREYNEDGTLKSIEQRVAEGYVELKDDEIIKDGKIEKKKAGDDEEEKLSEVQKVKLGLKELESNRKLITTEDGQEMIVEKSSEEKLEEGLMSKEEYNNEVSENRRKTYEYSLDPLRRELIDSVLSTLNEKGLLTEEQKKQLDVLVNERKMIKEDYKKV